MRDCRNIPLIHIPTRYNRLRALKSRCSWRRRIPAIGGRNPGRNLRSESCCCKNRCTTSRGRLRKTPRCLTSRTFRRRVAPTRVIASRGRCSRCTRMLRAVLPRPWKGRPVWRSSHGITHDKRQLLWTFCCTSTTASRCFHFSWFCFCGISSNYDKCKSGNSQKIGLKLAIVPLSIERGTKHNEMTLAVFTLHHNILTEDHRFVEWHFY